MQAIAEAKEKKVLNATTVLPDPQRVALVTGALDGLGRAICTHLIRGGIRAVAFDRKAGDDVCNPGDINAQLDSLGLHRLDILVNCAGINRIGYLEDFATQDWDEVMNVNAKGIFMMTRACLPHLRSSEGTVLNIVSNASHVPMTGSAAYNASKGAAHILTLQLARELTRRHKIKVFGISPNKLRGTGMSADIERQVCKVRGWTPEYAAEYQKNALLTGKETEPDVLAEFIAFLLSKKERHEFLSGCVIPYGA